MEKYPEEILSFFNKVINTNYFNQYLIAVKEQPKLVLDFTLDEENNMVSFRHEENGEISYFMYLDVFKNMIGAEAEQVKASLLKEENRLNLAVVNKRFRKDLDQLKEKTGQIKNDEIKIRVQEELNDIAEKFNLLRVVEKELPVFKFDNPESFSSRISARLVKKHIISIDSEKDMESLLNGNTPIKKIIWLLSVGALSYFIRGLCKQVKGSHNKWEVTTHHFVDINFNTYSVESLQHGGSGKKSEKDLINGILSIFAPTQEKKD